MRIAEALSKMKLQPFATEADVEEALRLFQVSTLDAALSGTLSGEQVWGDRPGGRWLWVGLMRDACSAGCFSALAEVSVLPPAKKPHRTPRPHPHQPFSSKMGRTASGDPGAQSS